MAGKKSKVRSIISKNDNIRHILTRLAVAQVLIIFGIWEIVQPVYWNSFVPAFVSSFMNINLFVQLHGIFILILGIAILIGAYLRISAALAALTTLAMIVFLLAGDRCARRIGLQESRHYRLPTTKREEKNPKGIYAGRLLICQVPKPISSHKLG